MPHDTTMAEPRSSHLLVIVSSVFDTQLQKTEGGPVSRTMRTNEPRGLDVFSFAGLYVTPDSMFHLLSECSPGTTVFLPLGTPICSRYFSSPTLLSFQ